MTNPELQINARLQEFLESKRGPNFDLGFYLFVAGFLCSQEGFNGDELELPRGETLEDALRECYRQVLKVLAA